MRPSHHARLRRKRQRLGTIEGASASYSASNLALHGLTAAIQRTDAERPNIQPTILSIAADEGLDLIVMGGYGHSRLQERILGGVTRGMI